MALITDEDQAFFEENGYVKVPNVVPEEYCEAAVDVIWECLGHDPDDPETWYDPPEGMPESWDKRSWGMVFLYHHQALWDTRQHPSVYQAFAEVLDEERLWVSLDKCNMTPPRHPDHPELSTSFIHVDADLSAVPSPRPRPYGVQGVLYLSDVAADGGGFQCVPEAYRNIDEIIASRSDAELEELYLMDHDETVAESELDPDAIETVPGEAGDLVIWDRALPHGNSHNDSDVPRLAQYILMEPARFGDATARGDRIDAWRNQEPYLGRYATPTRDPRNWEQERFEPAALTALGERLLGRDPWPGWSTMDAEPPYTPIT